MNVGNDRVRAAAHPVQAESARPVRFVAADGTPWSVVEVGGNSVPAARGPSCLVFSSEAVVRRVWRFPSEWQALSAADLFALSWTT